MPTMDNHYWIRIRVSSQQPAADPHVYTQQLASTSNPRAQVWVAVDPNEEIVLPPADGGVNYVHWVLESGLDAVIFTPAGARTGGIVMGDSWPVKDTRIPILESSRHATDVHYVMGFTNRSGGDPGGDEFKYEYTINFSCAGNQYVCDPKLGMGSPPT